MNNQSHSHDTAFANPNNFIYLNKSTETMDGGELYMCKICDEIFDVNLDSFVKGFHDKIERIPE